MKTGRPNATVALTADEVAQLQSLSTSRSIPHGLGTRARMILLSHDGLSNAVIAEKLGVTKATVGTWRQRFVTDRLTGLHDDLRPGRPRSHADDASATRVQKTLRTKPVASTQWSCRTMAEATGIPKSTIHRVWQAFGLQPHRQRTFKLSTDPFFVEKVRDIVGRYLNPPDKALVLCVDEKTQVQALNRTQPVLPLGLGYVEGVTHDYVRQGTTTLFAALNGATGTVLSHCRRRHRHQEFLAFLRPIDASVPKDLDVHLIVDTYATHKHPKVRGWVASRPRYHVHYPPTYASWLNQVDLWFRRISQQAIRRGAFRSVKDLVATIDHFVHTYNTKARPCAWTATADSILAKVRRLCERISGTQH